MTGARERARGRKSTGIPTEIVAERFNAGESIDELAADYGRRREEIEEAIRFEKRVEAA